MGIWSHHGNLWENVQKKPSKASNLLGIQFSGRPWQPARRFVDEQLAVDLGARRPVDLVAMISHDIPKSVEDGHGYGGFMRFPVHGGNPKSSIFIGFLWIFHSTPSSYWGLPWLWNPLASKGIRSCHNLVKARVRNSKGDMPNLSNLGGWWCQHLFIAMYETDLKSIPHVL